jgi:hypothetical protein
MDDGLFQLLNKISDGPHLNEFYELFGTKNKFYIHSDFDPRSNNFFYIRQSRQGDDIKTKGWQLDNLTNASTKNVIISSNSAYKEQQSKYIFDFIKYIVSKGNRNFKMFVSDYSRFSRNLEMTSKIYNYIFDNNINLLLDVDGIEYNYREDYYTKLRTKFKECENFSVELSREMKKVSKKKKEIKTKNNYSDKATQYFKTFISYKIKNLNYFKSLSRKNLTLNKIHKYKKETKTSIDLIQKDEYYYFHCPFINCMIICPEELAYIEGLNYTFIKGFDKEDFLAIANSNIDELKWICYNHNNFKMSDLKNTLPKKKKSN